MSCEWQALAGPLPAWNIQSHRQLGTVPYSIARRGEKTLIQRRRQDRLQRLGYQGNITGQEAAWSSIGSPAHMSSPLVQPIEAAEMRSR